MSKRAGYKLGIKIQCAIHEIGMAIMELTPDGDFLTISVDPCEYCAQCQKQCDKEGK